MLIRILITFLIFYTSKCSPDNEKKKPTDPLTKVQYRCKEQVEMGHVGVGGWEVCITNLTTNSIVYSFGIEKDMSFELDLLSKLELENIYTFDPTPYAKDWIATAQKFNRLPKGLHYIDCAISKVDGKITMFQYEGSKEHTSHAFPNQTIVDTRTFKAQRLKTIMHNLGHNHVDVLKLDIEGGEWPVLSDIARPPLLFSQLLIEFHHFEVHDLSETVRKLNRLGYKTFYIGERRRSHHMGYQEVGFIYTREGRQPIRPPQTLPPTTPQPTPFVQEWNFSQRELDRDKTLREMEALRQKGIRVKAKSVFDDNYETVYDRDAQRRLERDKKIEEKWGPEAQKWQLERAEKEAAERALQLKQEQQEHAKIVVAQNFARDQQLKEEAERLANAPRASRFGNL